MRSIWHYLYCASTLYVIASTLATPRDQPPFLNHTLSVNQTTSSNQTALLNHTLIEQDSNKGDDQSTFCDYTVSFDSLTELQTVIDAKPGSSGAKGTIRTDCVAAYALEALISMLDTAYNNYTIVNDGYNKEFGYYIAYMKNVVTTTLNDVLMFDVSDDNSLQVLPALGPGMQFFECKYSDGSEKIPCNKLFSSSDTGNPGQTIAMSLTDQNGYHAALQKLGIDPDWVHFGDYTLQGELQEPHGGDPIQIQFAGFPVEKTNMKVPNPKNIVEKALPSIPKLRDDMQATLMDILLSQYYNGSTSDAAQAYSTPVFMLMQAVHGMAQAKALGEKQQKIEEQAKVNIIIDIVSAVLVVIPFVGEEAATLAGLADLARAIAIAGEVGNAALAIYDTVKNPASAIINIIGMLVGVGAIAKVSRDGTGLAEVAKVQRGMDAATIGKLGGVFKNGVDELKPIMKVCKWS